MKVATTNPQPEIFLYTETNPVFERVSNRVGTTATTAPGSGLPDMATDFNRFLCPDPSCVFFTRMKGDSMIDAHIPANALLIIDRSIRAENNRVVAAMLKGELIIRQYIKNSSGARLMPANPKFQPLPLVEGMDCIILGTVTKIIVDLVP